MGDGNGNGGADKTKTRGERRNREEESISFLNWQRRRQNDKDRGSDKCIDRNRDTPKDIDTSLDRDRCIDRDREILRYHTVTVGPHFPGLLFLFSLILTLSYYVVNSRAFLSPSSLYSFFLYGWSSLVLLSL